MGVIQLSPLDLVLAASLVLLLGLTSYRLGLGLERRLAISALRTTVQLLLIGQVLRLVFANGSIWFVLGIATIMLAVAGREVMARQKYRFPGLGGWLLGTGSMFISSFTVALLALTVIIGNDPWYSPQYAIPLLGMLLGNTMNGVALSMDRFTETLWQQRQVVEQRLLLGQSSREAVDEIRRSAVRSGMIPIINSMAAAGIVSLPGMMTGQILGGSSPMDAVKYQILIMFLLCGGTGFGTMFAVAWTCRRLFDDRHRLRIDTLYTQK
ncbi:iron export ABC transporter permease subunit FetB [Desulfolithobacter dissulfuricans]|uniref:Iron export ABC transporter permease subunit FetB n=1 Tax=Desulfolithobacter dissulfuricans TaxID=2795293 RepID=A0A915UAL0_9BACT|nr:iron export ABC transporter permease subunit FetB [Desulfolithobacter dissulfuricans]BCO09680.1 iron export ABC transporter permease subunit FetB [Desulfolithobacter dissulfuricans]